MRMRRIWVILSVLSLVVPSVTGQIMQPPAEYGGDGCQECVYDITLDDNFCYPGDGTCCEPLWTNCQGGWSYQCMPDGPGSYHCQRFAMCGDRCSWA